MCAVQHSEGVVSAYARNITMKYDQIRREVNIICTGTKKKAQDKLS